jgi:hypothetical protein
VVWKIQRFKPEIISAHQTLYLLTTIAKAQRSATQLHFDNGCPYNILNGQAKEKNETAASV